MPEEMSRLDKIKNSLSSSVNAVNEKIYMNKLHSEIKALKKSFGSSVDFYPKTKYDSKEVSISDIFAWEIQKLDRHKIVPSDSMTYHEQEEANNNLKIQYFEKMAELAAKYPQQSGVYEAFQTALFQNFNFLNHYTLEKSPVFVNTIKETARRYINGDFEHLEHPSYNMDLISYIYPIKSYNNWDEAFADINRIIALRDSGNDTIPVAERDQELLSALLGGLKKLDYNNPKDLFKKWSMAAGKLKDKDASVALAKAMPSSYAYTWVSQGVLVASFMLNNDAAFQLYKDQDIFNYKDIAYALPNVAEITPEKKQFLANKLGPKFADFYVEHREQIDKCPRKDLFYPFLCDSLRKDIFIANFTDSLANKDSLKTLPSSEGIPSQYFDIINKEYEKFLEEYKKNPLHPNFMPQKSFIKNTSEGYQKSYQYWKNDFVERMPLNQEYLDSVTRFARNAIRTRNILNEYSEEQRINRINNDDYYPRYDHRLAEDICSQNITDPKLIRQIADIFYSVNERPETYMSDYNNYFPKQIASVAVRQFPEWMTTLILQANDIGVISLSRLGSEKTLFDACKAWKLNPYIWKKEAEIIGRMPLKSRIVAANIHLKMFDSLHESNMNDILNKNHKLEFWNEFKQAQDMGMDKALKHYVADTRTNRKRVVSLLNNSRLSQKETETIVDNVSVANILDLKIGHFHKSMNIIMDLQWQQKGNEGKVSDIFRKNAKLFDNENDNKEIIAQTLPSGFDSFYNDYKDDIHMFALTASRVFGSKFPTYVKKVMPYADIHDALYWLPRNLNKTQNEEFANFVMREIVYSDTQGNKHLRKLDDMRLIADHWINLSPYAKKQSFKNLLSICRSKNYSSAKYPKFSEEASRFGVQEEDYKRYEQIYEIGLFTPSPFSTAVSFSSGKLHGRFLPRDDVRVGFFGNYTTCCQHIGGIGEQCAVSSMKDPFSQLFVVENDKGEIIAGSWIWENKASYPDTHGKERLYKTATFDNIEAHPELLKGYGEADIFEIYKQAGQYLAQQDYRQISIGTGNSDISLDELSGMRSIPLNSMYSGYSDADTQVLLCENPKAKPLNEKASELYITGACQSDRDSMAIVAAKSFPDGAQYLAVPTHSPCAMLLKDDKKTVGYILWSEDSRNMDCDGSSTPNWIYDMAVLPDYRGQKGGNTRGEGSLLLLNAMMKHVKEVGGEWGAELRDKTTLKYMTMMADKVKNAEAAGISPNFEGRCLIDLEILSHDHEMGDGSNVYAVKFNILDKQERDNRLKKRLERKNTVLSPQKLSKIKENNTRG